MISSLVESVVKKANSRLKFLYRYQSCMDLKTRHTLCFALIQCLFDYANPAWYSKIDKSDQKKLKIIQNKMMRFINCSGPRTHVGYSELFKAGFLEVDQRSKQLVLHHMHKIYHIRSNHYIRSNFDLVTDVHDYNTRNSRLNFNLPERVGSIGNSFYNNYFPLLPPPLFLLLLLFLLVLIIISIISLILLLLSLMSI